MLSLLLSLSLLSSKKIRRFFVFIKNCLLKNQGRHGIIPGNDTRNDGIIPANDTRNDGIIPANDTRNNGIIPEYLHRKEKIRIFAHIIII